MSESGIDVAIITVKDEEFAAVHRCLREPTFAPGPNDAPNLYGWETGWIDRADGHGAYHVVLAVTGRPTGVTASQATIETVKRWSPRYVVLVGIAGGLPREGCALGDVVVSSVICGYEYGKLEKHFAVRPRTFEPDQSLLAAAARFKAVRGARPLHGAPYEVLVGPVASGDKIVDDPDSDFFAAVEEVFPGLQAVEMEGAGAASAIQLLQSCGLAVGFIMVRGVSDMPRAGARDAQKDERDRNLARACATAADFTVAFIAESWPVVPAHHRDDRRRDAVRATDTNGAIGAERVENVAIARPTVPRGQVARHPPSALELLDARIRESSDPTAVFNATLELLDHDAGRALAAVAGMRRTTLATMFDKGAVGVAAGDVVRLAAFLESTTRASTLAAILRALDRIGVRGDDRAARLRAIVARRLRVSHRAAVHVVWRRGDPVVDGFVGEIYQRLSRNRDDRTAPGLRVPVLLHGHPDDIVAVAQRASEAAQAERSLVVVLADSAMVLDPAWRPCLDALDAAARDSSSRLALLPLTVGLATRSSPFQGVRFLALPADVDVRRVLIEIELALLRVLTAESANRAPVRLFLSHTKVDAATAPMQILGLARTIVGVEPILDAFSLAPGAPLDTLLDDVVGSVFIAFASPHYAARPWCRRELLTAKRHGVPMLVVDLEDDDIGRAFPYLGNVPRIRWSDRPQMALRVMEGAIFEALRDRYVRGRLEDVALVEDELRAATVVTRSPELLDLALRKDEGGTLLHPDPALADEERELLAASVPGWRITSPGQFHAERTPLYRTGWPRLRVGVSVSDSDLWIEGCGPQHVDDARVDITRALVLGGATLATGGDLRDDGTTEVLLELVEQRRSSEGVRGERARGAHVVSYLAWPIHLGLKPEREAYLSGLVQFVRGGRPESIVALPAGDTSPRTPEGRYLWARSLTAMRREMIASLDALVVLGGRTAGYMGRYAGVVEEVALAMSIGKPVFLLGGFGGAASAIADAILGRPSPRLGSSFQLAQAIDDSWTVRDFVAFCNDTVARDPGANPAHDSIDHDLIGETFRQRGIGGLNNGLGELENRALLLSASVEQVSLLVQDGLRGLIGERGSGSAG